MRRRSRRRRAQLARHLRESDNPAATLAAIETHAKRYTAKWSKPGVEIKIRLGGQIKSTVSHEALRTRTLNAGPNDCWKAARSAQAPLRAKCGSIAGMPRESPAPAARFQLFAATAFTASNVVAADLASQSTFGNVVSLITALAWPATVLLLVFFYRGTLRRILSIFERRVAQGDTVSAFGISVEGRGAPLPAATASAYYDAAKSAVIAGVLRLQAGSSALVALGELSKGDDESAVVGTGDALGLAIVQAALLQVTGVSITSQVIRKESGASRELLDRYHHVVSIGGPEANRLSGVIMGANYLTFEFKPGGVYDKLQHKLNIVEFSDNGMNGTDWAIMIIAANPRNADGTAVVLAGYSGYGTNAAAVVFSRIDEFRQLHGKYPLEALIRVNITEGAVATPDVVTVRLIPSVGQSNL